MKKLVENLDETIWENIKKIDKENFDKIENELKIKFPENDVKYLRNFNRGTSINTVFFIDDEEFNVELSTFNCKYFFKNLDHFHRLTGDYFSNRKIVPVVSKTKFLTEIDELKEYVIAQDFVKDSNNPEIIYITYRAEDVGLNTIYRYKYIEGSVTEKKLGDKSSVILDYMYVTDEKPKEAEVGWLFEEFSTKEEIEEFQEEIGLRFPEKYLNFLYKAIDENGIRIYPEKYKSKYRKELSDTNFEYGAYMMLEQIKSNYQFLLDEFKPYPKKLIPIFDCLYERYICLDYRGKLNTTLKEPRITYFNSEEEGNRRFVPIADSYEAFLDMIEIDEKKVESEKRAMKERYLYGYQILEMIKDEEQEGFIYYKMKIRQC